MYPQQQYQQPPQPPPPQDPAQIDLPALARHYYAEMDRESRLIAGFLRMLAELRRVRLAFVQEFGGDLLQQMPPAPGGPLPSDPSVPGGDPMAESTRALAERFRHPAPPPPNQRR